MTIEEQLEGCPRWYKHCVRRMTRLERWLWHIGYIEPQSPTSWVWTADGTRDVVTPLSAVVFFGALFCLAAVVWR